ncbi:MAG: hypothetical protein QNJ42_00900 [Crocosphaera sp.]|nr:hypothetical protein [Crocosphaera sp.]
MSDISTTKQNNNNKQKIYDEALLARSELYKAKNKAIAKSEDLAKRCLFEMVIAYCSFLICVFGVWTITDVSDPSLQNDFNIRQFSQELTSNRWILGSLTIGIIASLLWSSDTMKKTQLRTKIHKANKVLSKLDQELFGIES